MMPTILITGASKGFGRELLDVYARQGWTVFPLVRDKMVAGDLESTYRPECHPIVADVTNQSVSKIICKILDKYSDSLDLLINNAGNIKKNRGIYNTRPEDLPELFDVHCVGALRVTQAVLPYLKRAANPIVINISSRWSSIGMTTAGKGAITGIIYSYKIAKAGQNMLTACLNQDLKADGIKVFGIHPGRLKTTAAAADADVNPHDAAERLFNWIAGIDENLECRLYDLTTGTPIEW